MSDSSEQNIRQFYDEYAERQSRVGINIRHRTILKKCIEAGLSKDSHVLEVGCGIGTLTRLLSKYCSLGTIVATDISPQSIEIAREGLGLQTNVSCIVTDMVGFASDEKFDFVVFPDVLEHIPVEQHPELFQTIAKCSHMDATICVHIPNPPYLRHFHKNNPQALQIIDQPLDTLVLMQSIYAADFYVESILSYSLSTIEKDYQFMVFRKGRYHEHSKIRLKPFWQKILDEVKSRL